MPIPAPQKDESKDEYLKRIIPILVSEGKSPEQSTSIASSMYDEAIKNNGIENKPVKNKSKIEILSDIKKLIEKNGYQMSDEEILSIFDRMSQPNTASKTFQLSLHQLSKTNEYEIMIFPRKKVYIEKYQKYENLNSILFQQIISAFSAGTLFPPIVDLNHKLEESYGTIKEIYEKSNGLFAKIDFTDEGIKLIKEKKYSFISPEWGDRTDNEGRAYKNVLWAITLTNIPALENTLPTLQAQMKLSKFTNGGKGMDFRTKLAKFEGQISTIRLQDGAPVMEPGNGDMSSVINEILSTLKEAVAKIEEVTGQKEVAENKAQEAQASLTKIQDEKKAEEKKVFFEKMIETGRLELKESEDWQKQFDMSPEFVRKMLEMRNAKSGGVKTMTTQKETNMSLSKEDEEIMRDQGFVLENGNLDTYRYQKEVLEKIPANSGREG